MISAFKKFYIYPTETRSSKSWTKEVAGLKINMA